jgi:alpha-N-acetylglucosamine transferase
VFLCLAGCGCKHQFFSRIVEGGTFGSWQLMTSQLDKVFSTPNTNTLDNTLSNDIKQSPIHHNEHDQQHHTSHSTTFCVEPSPQTEMYNHHVWATDNFNILCFDDIPEFSFAPSLDPTRYSKIQLVLN